MLIDQQEARLRQVELLHERGDLVGHVLARDDVVESQRAGDEQPDGRGRPGAVEQRLVELPQC